MSKKEKKKIFNHVNAVLNALLYDRLANYTVIFTVATVF